MRPIVSCIVPVHNGERFLGETIESISSPRIPQMNYQFDDVLGRVAKLVEIADGAAPGFGALSGHLEKFPRP